MLNVMKTSVGFKQTNDAILHLGLLGKELWEAKQEKALGREVSVALNRQQKEQGVQNLAFGEVHFWLLLVACFVTLGKLRRLSEPRVC